jgi:hypothetical protein
MELKFIISPLVLSSFSGIIYPRFVDNICEEKVCTGINFLVII